MNTEVLDVTGVTLIDGSGAPAKSDCSLRIDRGRIVAIWTGDARPPDAQGPESRTVHAAGKTMMPGIIDSHCHVSYGEGRSAEEVDVYGGAEWSALRAAWNCGKILRAGVTGICDPGSTWMVAVAVRDAINNGMFPGPRMYAAGRHIAADGGFADYFPTWVEHPISAEGVTCSTPDEMVREVRRQIKNRVDLIKISGDSQAQDRIADAGSCFSDGELKAIVDTAHRLGRKTTIHARYAETVRAAVRAKVDWIIHASYMRRDDIGFVRDSRIPICPTLTFTANAVEFGPEVGMDPGYVEFKKRELDALADIHSRAHKAGIPLMAGSESGFSITPYGEWHAREIELMVKLVGMSPMEAIVSATRANAEVIGWAADVGTLTVGKRADFLLLDGNPLADIGLLSRPSRLVAVYKDGVEVDRRGPIPMRNRMSHERGYGVSNTWLHPSREKLPEAAE